MTMRPVMYIDFETRSEMDLRDTGVYRYAEHATTDVLCVCYAVGDEPVNTWFPGEPVPVEIQIHQLLGGDFVAHQKDFERILWRCVMAPRYGWPEPDLNQWHCTAALACAQSLPRALGEAAYVLGAPEQKDDEGRQLMLKMCRPRDILTSGDTSYARYQSLPPGGREIMITPDGRIIVWWNETGKIQRLASYCTRDVEATRAIHKRLHPMTPPEREIFLLDATINDRGLLMDERTICNAQKIVDGEKEKLAAEMQELTNGCASPTSPKSIVAWLVPQGIPATSVSKEAIGVLLSRNDLTKAQRRVLEIRAEASKTSTAKLRTMLDRRSRDGRVRGNFIFHGAHTGRWTSQGVQFQNMRRPAGEIPIPAALDALIEGQDPRAIDLLLGPPISVVSECMRGMIMAAPGHDFVTADFANIEGRVNAWLADELWKLEAFRTYDTIIGEAANSEPIRKGPDPYLLAASHIYGVPVASLHKKSPQRQIGKVAELALGYGGGIGAFQNMAKNYQVHVEDKFAEKIKNEWRTAHRNIVASWKAMDDAALRAVANVGEIVRCCNEKLAFVVHGPFLWMRLPSGRFLAYCRPRIAIQKRSVKVLDPETEELKEIEVEREAVHFWGTDGKTKKWTRHVGYGGFWCENAVQAISRDFLAEAMLRAEAAGYHIVLHAHDELVAEVPKTFGSLKEFEQFMAVCPTWAQDCPIVAEGWRAARYGK